MKTSKINLLLTLVVMIAVFLGIICAAPRPGEALRVQGGDVDTTYARMLELMAPGPIEFSVTEDFRSNIDQSARKLLPNTRLLAAVNILMSHDNIKDVKKIVINPQADKNSATIKGGVLDISLRPEKDLRLSDIIAVFEKNLGWDLTDTINKLGRQYPYLLSDGGDFKVINIILHSRMAGLGDLVFVINAAQTLKKALPDKKIRLIFHTAADFKLVCETKLLKDLDPDKALQEAGGIEVLNAQDYAIQKYGTSRKELYFVLENHPWYRAQKDFLKKDDVSIVYALGSTEKEVFNDMHLFNHYAGDARARIFIHELGFSSLIQEPLKQGWAYLGFGDDNIGMSPVSPKSEELYRKKYPRQNERIRLERRRILEKLKGSSENEPWQKNLDAVVESEWGFLYAHRDYSITRYFNIFERARSKSAGYRQTSTTFFIMCGRTDVNVHEEVKKIAGANDYNLFIYANENRSLEVSRQSVNNNVTIVMDYSVPRKLFSELFLYSDDLPTLVSGQDNLANILYMNLLSSGRPFFWETLIFQTDAMYQLLIYLESNLSKADSKYLRMLWDPREESDDQAEMFSAPRKYREFFKKIATAVDRHASFAPQVYYLILDRIYKAGTAPYGADELLRQLRLAREKET